ncbi:MAG TPA: TIGR03086 family metal-binding protein [Actinomycetes bacterium]|jgi:uncharacterized protein (TIGR03086 family)|nr:TIGR03086 family metal-binding protein [Actinomycetes bacterium]
MQQDVRDLYQRAMARFGAHVHAVRDDQWSAPTPCSAWDVRTLVNHLVSENRWAPPLFQGRTIAEVGDQFEGDLLGDDPRAAWDDSAGQAVAAVREDGAMDRTVHLSFGDFPGREYAMQLFADALIHGWDLARAIGGDDRLDPDMVEACGTWFARVEDAYRAGGAIAPRPELPAEADGQARLLAMFGRTG